VTPHAADTDIWIEAIRSVCYPSVYMDIGAGDGFDCGLVKNAFPDCRCIAIDPVEKWEVDDRVEKYRDVISFENDDRVFHVKKIAGIHGLYSRVTEADDHMLALPARTLRHVCEREMIPNVDAMKIDVEGAAWDVLVGAGDFLRGTKAIHVETEWLPLFKGQHLEDDVFRILKSYGFTKTYENRVEDLGQGDSIWLRQ
jgi:FkbM family methyltransferase